MKGLLPKSDLNHKSIWKFFISVFAAILLTTSSINAQRIKVLEAVSNEPVSGVLISNKNKSKTVITNFNGEAIIDKFGDNEIMFFENLLYNVSQSTKTQLQDTDYVMYLTLSIEGLNEIVISVSKFEQSKRDIPQTVVSVNKDEIAFTNPQTSADLLNTTGNIFIQKSQLGGGSPIIRGFSTNRLLISVDGVRMNNAIFRGGNIQNVISLDPFTIKNTEVTLGAGSVVYGSDAIGGVMNFYTTKPQLSYKDSLFFKGNALLRYSSANEESTSHVDLNFGFKKWAFLSSLSFTDYDDLRMGSNGPSDYLRNEFAVRQNEEDIIVTNPNPLIQRPTAYDQINIMQKARYEPSDKLFFDFGLHYSTTSDFARYDRLILYDEDQLKYAEWNYGPQQWLMGNAQVTRLSSKSNLYDKLQTTVAYQNFKESRISRIFRSDIRQRRQESVDAISLNLDLEKELNPKLNLFYGIEYIYNKVNSSGLEEDITTANSSKSVSRYPNGSTWQSAALYSSFKYKPNSKFVFQTGLRYNYVRTYASFKENNEFLNLPFDDAKLNSGAFTSTAGFSWFPNETIQWKLNASTAFRAPNIDDIGKVFDSEPGSVVVPNNDLKPEYAYGGELGLKLNFEDKVIIDLATYYTFLDNALIRRAFSLSGQTQIEYDDEVSDVQAIQNASKAWIYGFEAGVEVRFTDVLKLRSQYNVVGGTEDDNGIEVPIRHVAPNFGNTRLIWNNNKFKLDAFVIYNNALSFNQLAPSEIAKSYLYAVDTNGNPFSPSWYTINFRSQYQINNEFEISAAIENITDQRYRPYSSGISAAGRNLIVAVKYSL